jgi:flavorubredoxin
MSTVTEITPGVFRIGAWWPEYGITINQFLIPGDRPALIHTGTFPAYEHVRKAVAEVIDPKSLAYVVCPHFEGDECGGMGRFLAEAPAAQFVCSEMGAAINLSAWDYAGPVKPVRNNDVIELGGPSNRRLRFLETPHVHHWDSMMIVEETTGSLFPADLFIQPGEQPPVITEDLGGPMCELYRGAGIFAGERPVLTVVDRIEQLQPKWTHPMHGGSMTTPTLAKFIQALRTQPFTYDGRLLGRVVAS